MQTITRSSLMALLGGIKNVSNLSSPRSYRPVANQYNLTMENGMAFQSYDSLIAVRFNGKLYLTDYHDYSNTTSKYATEWTGYTTQERRQGLKEGRFILITD